MNFFKKIIGKTNQIEKTYIYIFILSIISGIIHGIVREDYYKCCESSLNFSESESLATIFISNLILSSTNLITAGLSSIYLNFHTFSIASSFLHSQKILIALPFLFTYGFFEIFGVMLFGLTGLSLFQKKILKRKSSLKGLNLIFYGTFFLLVGAIIEISLIYLLQ